MTFPAVEAVALTFDGTTNPGPHTINLPAGIQAGDLLLIAFHGRNETSVTLPDGFALLDFQAGSSNSSGGWYYRVADGTEGATVSRTGSGVALWRTCYIAYRISGAAVGEAAYVEADMATGTDPPSLTPSWGAVDTLWLTSYGRCPPAGTYTPPTGFTNQQIQKMTGEEGSTNNNYPVVTTARKDDSSGSLNPGAWVPSTGTSLGPAAATVAVRPSPVTPSGNRIGGTGAIRRPSRPDRGGPPPDRGGGPPPDRGRPADKGPPPGQEPPTTEPPSGPGPDVEPPVDDNWLPPRGDEDR